MADSNVFPAETPTVDGTGAPRFPLAPRLAARLRNSSHSIVQRWLERIVDRASLEPNKVFPSEQLLDHVPILIEGIADDLEDPAAEISAHGPVIAKAMELGTLRYSQGFDVYEILKEYEILGGILFSFVAKVVDDLDEDCTRAELVYCSHRIFRSISIIQQATAEQFLTVARDRVNDREQRLRAFHRAVSEDAKNRVVLLKGAAKMLLQPGTGTDADRTERFGSMLQNNIDGLGVMLDDLADLSSLDLDVRQRQNILLRDAIGEAVRQLRDLASAHHVDVAIATGIPEIEVPAAVVELCVSNYVSNAIKYHDGGKQERLVVVDAEVVEHKGNCEIIVRVSDNGIGVTEDARKDLFRRFVRSEKQNVAGSGLGLSLVRDFTDSVGGRAWAELDDPNRTVFCFALPCRRSRDTEEAQPAA